MAKKSTSRSTMEAQDLAQRSRYPIGLLFQVSTLAGCVTYLLMSLSGHVDINTALYRSLFVFIGFSVCIGILMVSVISVLHKVKMKEMEEKIKMLHEERLAEQQMIEAQERQEAEFLQQQAGLHAIPTMMGDPNQH